MKENCLSTYLSLSHTLGISTLTMSSSDICKLGKDPERMQTQSSRPSEICSDRVNVSAMLCDAHPKARIRPSICDLVSFPSGMICLFQIRFFPPHRRSLFFAWCLASRVIPMAKRAKSARLTPSLGPERASPRPNPLLGLFIMEKCAVVAPHAKPLGPEQAGLFRRWWSC